MILFGGGVAGNEFLDQLDFQLFKDHPKLIVSYSNGTALLNIIYLNTLLECYYVQFPCIFDQLTEFDKTHFENMFINEVKYFQKSKQPWISLTPGISEGLLIGGYTTVMATLVYQPLFKIDPNEKYILFLEESEKFSDPGTVLSNIAYIEQSPLMKQVTGIIFGNYAPESNKLLLDGLTRLGIKHHIPVLKCDDFGHGDYHGIIPIGRKAILDGNNQTLKYL